MPANQPLVVHWFRRDLRLHDNTALFHALERHGNVLPVFIFDKVILDRLQDKNDPRVTFIYNSLLDIHHHLQSAGSGLRVYYGEPLDVFRKLLASFDIRAVFTNEDYEPYARERDHKVAQLLAAKNIPMHTFKDQVVFSATEILKQDGTPYTVFTPYALKWKSTLANTSWKQVPSETLLHRFLKTPASAFPDLKDFGFSKAKNRFPPPVLPGTVLERYEELRDIPSAEGTSRLSIHLRFGTLSIRELMARALPFTKWLNELIWREFYMQILWHFPHVVTNSFKPAYDRISWINNEEHFDAWCNGRTGYPIVDAGMRQLNETGFMHNRVRMITAAFLTKHLLTDWRWGEAYFAARLLDFELASNNGGWQWSASSGVDAAPYFRIFNPYEQTRKFDPDYLYINKWVPEWNTPAYPKPLVEHQMARIRALDTYKVALRP